ncbi:MAG: helix-turn-helix domain-containing protein [Acidimicrobiia bacterium]
MKKGYGQYCPLAKAIDIIGERWTPLVLRELLMGGRRFNEIRRGVPLMSPALLTKRLKDLERSGVIDRVRVEGSRTHEYRLTPAGEELRPIVAGLAVWGLKWVEDRLGKEDLDAGVLMWDIRGRIDPAALPEGRTVIQFEFSDAPKTMRLWWLVIENGETDLCLSDPGYEVDLYLATDLRSMAEVWLGRVPLRHALRDGTIELIGSRTLERSIASWLQLSKVYEVAEDMHRRSSATGSTR